MPEEGLLVMDMLNDFVLEGAPLEVPDARAKVPNIRREIERFRAEGKPVIYICDRHAADDREFARFGWPPHAVKGTMGASVVKELRPLEGETIVEKTSYSGFYDTRLDWVLRQRGIKKLTFTGCVTHICIMFIAFEAALRGYEIVVPEDCVGGLAKEDHDAALRIMKNVLGADVRLMAGAAG